MVRDLVIIFGDQLDEQTPALIHFDKSVDVVWMAEVRDESTYVWSHKARIALFLSAMRHFREKLRENGFKVEYVQLDDPENQGSLSEQLLIALRSLCPERVVFVEPGEWRVLNSVRSLLNDFGTRYEILEDNHFFCSRTEFAAYAVARKQLRMEFFYRYLRRKHNVLMNEGQPTGGRWNFDTENRRSFGKEGPGRLPPPIGFSPDEITLRVFELVERWFQDHPGSLEAFDWAVTREQAEVALDDFIQNRLPFFGEHQDAMWSKETFLYHSRLSSAMNLKLLNPRSVVERAENALLRGAAPLASVEGFIRQILGWREYVRGVYWHFMPDYEHMNAMNAEAHLPSFYWTGDTQMNCLKEVITQTLQFGYAHHIQRLMVTGLYALLLGVRPQEVHRWYLAVYVDAVEWVELPNTVGMSQFADGGLMSSKPYAASGKYIQRMSSYCNLCAFNPSQAVGEQACPFTTLYWDFLIKHEEQFKNLPRMELQVRNLKRLSAEQRKAIQAKAAEHRQSLK